MGALVSSLGCTAFSVACDAGLVPKPLLVTESPKNRKKPTRPETNVQKVAKLKFVQGVWCSTWKDNMWIAMSP